MIVEILNGTELTRIKVDSCDRSLHHTDSGMIYLQMHGEAEVALLFESDNELVGFRSQLP